MLDLCRKKRSLIAAVRPREQLETALHLWFLDADPVSIHTLAVAAQGVLTAICRDTKQPPSDLKIMLDSKPKGFQKWFRNPQNFFKHGHYEGQKDREVIRHTPDVTELALADAVGMFQRLFGCTSIMELFFLQCAVAFPKRKILKKASLIELFESLEIEEVAKLNREAFYNRFMPVIESLHSRKVSA